MKSKTIRILTQNNIINDPLTLWLIIVRVKFKVRRESEKKNVELENNEPSKSRVTAIILQERCDRQPHTWTPRPSVERVKHSAFARKNG